MHREAPLIRLSLKGIPYKDLRFVFDINEVSDHLEWLDMQADAEYFAQKAAEAGR